MEDTSIAEVGEEYIDIVKGPGGHELGVAGGEGIPARVSRHQIKLLHIVGI